MAKRVFETGEVVRQKGWDRRTTATLVRRIETKSGRTGWWARHSAGHWMALEDGSFLPLRGKRKRKDTTK